MAEESDERSFFLREGPSQLETAPEKQPRRKKDVSPHAGHRQRLRDRFDKGGENALADYELLELLLFRTFRQGDTKPLAKELIKRFGSFGDVLAADPARLAEVKGMGPSSAQDLKIVAAAARALMKTQMHGREVLSSWSAVLDYCTAAMAYETREQFRILFLDKKNALIADEVQQTGTVDHTPVYPREVLRRSLELSATAIILVHNHPSGDPTPSRADIEMTKHIMDALRPLSIVLHDHIIIGKQGHASLKGLGLI